MKLPSSKRAANILAALTIGIMLGVVLSGVDFRSIAQDLTGTSVASPARAPSG